LELIVRLDPWNAINYFEMGLIYKQKGDLVKMVNMKEKILNFASNTKIADEAIRELT
jgi:hypothetical protein